MVFALFGVGRRFDLRIVCKKNVGEPKPEHILMFYYKYNITKYFKIDCVICMASLYLIQAILK